ncbi:50S ribosomal protein L1 [Patescibacteria group bacterium]|nr:50S ribosomal protein L1 [Patescibacteria group bacterium]
MGKTKTAFIGEEAEEKKLHGKKAFGPERAKRVERVHLAGLKGGQRIKTVEAEALPEETPAEKEEAKKVKAPKVRGKKYLEAKAKVKVASLYPLEEAIKLVKETSYSKFDGSVELHLLVKKIGISANVALPNSAGKEKKIEVANEDTVKKLAAGKIDFDVLLATADMMPKLVPFARILGPKGLMPNPKNGTLISDIKKAKEFSRNSVTIKTEKEAPLIHTVVGKVSQKESELTENVEAIFKAFGGSKQIVKAFVKASMGPSIKIKV